MSTAPQPKPEGHAKRTRSFCQQPRKRRLIVAPSGRGAASSTFLNRLWSWMEAYCLCGLASRKRGGRAHACHGSDWHWQAGFVYEAIVAYFAHFSFIRCRPYLLLPALLQPSCLCAGAFLQHRFDRGQPRYFQALEKHVMQVGQEEATRSSMQTPLGGAIVAHP
jgi:hypothetical protein